MVSLGLEITRLVSLPTYMQMLPQNTGLPTNIIGTLQLCGGVSCVSIIMGW